MTSRHRRTVRCRTIGGKASAWSVVNEWDAIPSRPSLNKEGVMKISAVPGDRAGMLCLALACLLSESAVHAESLRGNGFNNETISALAPNASERALCQATITGPARANNKALAGCERAINEGFAPQARDTAGENHWGSTPFEGLGYGNTWSHG